MLAVGDPISICENVRMGLRALSFTRLPQVQGFASAHVDEQHQQQKEENLSELTMGTFLNES